MPTQHQLETLHTNYLLNRCQGDHGVLYVDHCDPSSPPLSSLLVSHSETRGTLFLYIRIFFTSRPGLSDTNQVYLLIHD